MNNVSFDSNDTLLCIGRLDEIRPVDKYCLCLSLSMDTNMMHMIYSELLLGFIGLIHQRSEVNKST